MLSQLDDEMAVHWTPAEINHGLNVGQRLWCLLTLCLERTVDFLLSTDGRAFYSISDQITDYLVPLRVSLYGVRLKADTMHNLDLRSTTWRKTAGDPVRYAQHGFDLLAITPQPTTGMPVLAITYAAEPAEMVFDSDVPDIEAEQQIWLEDFATWYALLKNGGAELKAGVMYLNQFLDAAAKYGHFTRARSKAQMYDNYPPDLSTFERGRFLIKLRNEPAQRKEAQTPKGTGT